MQWTKRDTFATLLVAAVLIPYVGYLIRGEMPFIQDPRGMAAVGIVGLLLAFVAWGLGIGTMFGKVMLGLGVIALGLGIGAAIVGVEGSALLLAVFMGGIVLVWAIETLFHAGFFGRAAPRAH